MASDETIHTGFRIHKTNKTQLENFYFHYLPKLYIGFNILRGVTDRRVSWTFGENEL